MHKVGDSRGIVIDEIAPSKKVTRIWNSGGHDIYLKSKTATGEDTFLEHVQTQAEAEERVRELGSEHHRSEPVGTSGQATPWDRILMIKRKNAKIYDRYEKEINKRTNGKNTNPLLHLHVTKHFLEWVVNLEDKNEKRRYLRRLNKLEIAR